MALNKTLKIKTNLGIDVEVPNAYVKISGVFGNKSEMTAEVHICKAQGEEPVQRRTYAYPYQIDGANHIKQGYEFLKTLSEFAGATDC
jgi:hypothetical protein